ncbi:hypothetical protein [Orenia marismortui]|uniref:Lysozyme n=1 Tax=Orenia marismortui TaxID=46469 RepID=A0A4R8HL16_9FIRM|nr:hypothetical protein [Orenia marismortui]TDX58964.1 hypothetical protein C7959_102102 [Orenia marismortui]
MSLGYNERKQLKKILLEGENKTTYMYCDTKGNVTIGVGHLISNLNVAIKLPFKRKSDNHKADANDIEKEYKKMKSIWKKNSNYIHTYYGKKASLYISEADIDNTFKLDILKKEINIKAALQKKGIVYDNLSREVQLAIFDMAYNMGATGLVNKFPNFIVAIKDANYKEAAKQSSRLDVSKKRNLFVKRLLLKAVVN